MVFGKTSALPGNTDGLFVANENSEVLERPACLAGEQKEHSVCEPAVSAYKEVFSKAAMEGPGKSVSKVEAHGDKDGTVEGKGPNVGKVEGVGKTGVDTVGKSEHKDVGKSIGKFEGKGKAEGIGKTVGKSGEETSQGKVEQMGKSEGKGPNVGKAEQIGKSEGKNVGKTQGETVGKAENESVGKLGKNEKTGKTEGDAGKAVGKVSDKSVGKDEPSEESIRQAGEKFQKLTTDSKDFVIAVAGKSEADTSFAGNIISAGELKLPEGATLVAYKQTVATEGGFRVDVFMDQLTSRQFGRLLFYARELPSTHTLLSQNCKALPVGTLSVADTQFQGKGRAGNSWESPKGCLMFSFTLQMSDGRAVPFLQYVASLAIIEAIESHCISKGLKAPEVKIKWPNDLYAKGLKVGGILCTSTYSSKKFHIVVGVGLNVGNRQPTTCLDALLEEINEKSPSLSRDELLAAIISKFENLFEVFSTQGFYALESDYYKRWLHSGQTVVLEERQEGTSEITHVPLKIQGLTPSGYLRALDDKSEAYELHPDGNSFDFLKGLMRKKL
jgi:biotin--protein ligase